VRRSRPLPDLATRRAISGFSSLPPATISLPFKLIFFVLVDGWRLVAGSLVESFQRASGTG
jgi:flagellar biosynthetic protein FliP